MDLTDIKVLKIDVTDWLIKAIYAAKEHPDKSKNVWSLNDDKTIVEFSLTHPDFNFFIDFDLYYDSCHVSKIDTDCKFRNYHHVSDLYPETDMIDFDDNRLEEIYRAVLSHF